MTGTSKVVQSNGSSLIISGSDGTAGDAVAAMTLGQSGIDQVANTLSGLGYLLDATDGSILIGEESTAAVTVSAGATLETDDLLNGTGNVYLAGTWTPTRA